MRMPSPAHAAFGATMAALGIVGLARNDFAPVWLPVADAMPARALWTHATAWLALATGIGLFLPRLAAFAARLLLVSLLAWLLLVRGPWILDAPTIDSAWAAGEIAVLAAAAWVLSLRSGAPQAGRSGDAWHMSAARKLYGAALVPFGLAHFIYPAQTAALVPAWLPWPGFWGAFTGAALVVAGITVLAGAFTRLAITASAIEIGLFTLLVWAPVIADGDASAFQRHEAIASWSLTVAAWVVAETWRARPWRALRAR